MFTGINGLPRKKDFESRRQAVLKRRRIIWLSTLGFILLVIIFLCLYQFTDVIFGLSEEVESAPQSGDWTMFRRDLEHTGSINPDGNLPQGTLQWTFSTGGAIHSSPAVVDGVVYFGSRDSYIYALDAATGEELWSFKTGSWVESSPVVVNGVVYCGSNDGDLYALNAATGTKLWSFEAEYAIRSSPAVANGVVYFGSDDYYVYAVDIATGKGLWKFETDSLITSSPIVIDGVVIVGSVDGSCYVLNAKNGRVRLNFKTHSSVVASPVVSNGIAYLASTSGFVYAIDYHAKNWPFENKLKIYWGVLYMYGAAPRPPDASGFIWMQWLGWGVRASSSPALVDGIIYLGAGNNLLTMDAATREVLWSFETGDAVVSSPAVAGSAVYAGSQDGRLYAVDRATGAKLWDGLTGDKITSSPAVANGSVYVGSFDGKLYAFE
ncbi:MAG TPA: PQQ-binding-like beta-propeller repeat protein [Dehalococcoidales bacterium]|nr:PQQ-binding-like beta-propeller repeat protein [Dehalococcoidales bacterium]